MKLPRLAMHAMSDQDHDRQAKPIQHGTSRSNENLENLLLKNIKKYTYEV